MWIGYPVVRSKLRSYRYPCSLLNWELRSYKEFPNHMLVCERMDFKACTEKYIALECTWMTWMPLIQPFYCLWLLAFLLVTFASLREPTVMKTTRLRIYQGIVWTSSTSPRPRSDRMWLLALTPRDIEYTQRGQLYNGERLRYGYGSIPINTIFSGMNIHLPTILGFTRGIRFWPIPI